MPPTLSPDQMPYECIQEEGDLLFVPSGWWHLVYNISNEKEGDDGLCIAMTQNYCSTQNFHRIAALFCGEKKSSFGRNFKETLQQVRPDLFQRWLEVEQMFIADRNSLVRNWGLVLPLIKENNKREEGPEEVRIFVNSGETGQDSL